MNRLHVRNATSINITSSAAAAADVVMLVVINHPAVAFRLGLREENYLHYFISSVLELLFSRLHYLKFMF